ncbi:MAG: hypothetical protein IT376_19215 [Polyangiaceae bacterium]|nr:hypothetical protein [Polyangiaceae bacterium]
MVHSLRPPRPLLLALLSSALGLAACGGAGWEPRSPASGGTEVARTSPAERAESEVEGAVEELLAHDPSMARFFDEAYGFAVFPSVGKGGAGIGGAYGRGYVYERGVPVGTTSLAQVTVGFQLGGQAFTEVLFFQDERALREFQQGNFELGAQASAVAVTSGASADASYADGVAVFTLVKGGLMYEATVAGQKFAYRHAAPQPVAER